MGHAAMIPPRAPPSNIPYAEVSKEEKEKDRTAMLKYPDLLQSAGLELQRSPAGPTS